MDSRTGRQICKNMNFFLIFHMFFVTGCCKLLLI